MTERVAEQFFRDRAVRSWFDQKFDHPTPAQTGAWPAIAKGGDVLLAAPTGSGKTLAAFLWGIDQLSQRQFGDTESVAIVYVSPLKALSNDIARNLQEPLREIRIRANEMALAMPDISVGLRTGDSTPKQRETIYRSPPHILVTTPESLYLLLGSKRGRKALAGVETVIVDEIHALARDRRGSHLALTLARLDALTSKRAQRIGLSATQKPLNAIAAFLCGYQNGEQRPCQIIDCGHQRQTDLAVEVMDLELGAVASGEYMAALYERIADLVAAHRTTLVFVNTRSLSERIAFQLAERLGEEVVASHHGSLAKERRLQVEQQLKGGQLKALVATASLELGIDIGHINLVLQIGSPRSVTAFLQRLGRSGHAIGLVPKARLMPTSRDDLLECAAIVRSAREGVLDRVVQLVAPLDVLAQQVVAETGARGWDEDELFELFRNAGQYRELRRDEFDQVLEMLAEGLGEGGGRGYPLITRDRINGQLRGRRAARMIAATNAGTIPEQGDYQVIAEPDEMVVGSVNEDFAIESMAGDIFILGTNSWRILRVESGRVRVADAHGAPPTIPFWLGEGLGRTPELSEQVGRLRIDLTEALSSPAAAARLADECGLSESGMTLLLDYVRATRDGLGLVPTTSDVIFERFFDESGGMQLVVHAPFGQRITRAWGLALRKRFCVRFDFELQAAANDNCILLSLGPQQSFPLEESFGYVTAANARPALRQAILYTPLFPTRWRWNATRALFVRRFQSGRRVPPPIQRMRADDLLAAVFPQQVGCQENVTGPLEIPDQVLIDQTVRDCLTEAHDIAGLEEILSRIESGEIRLHARDVTEPSPMSHEIINGRPFTFLDDAPLEERRSRAVQLRQTLPVNQRELGALDAKVIEQVQSEVAPDPRDADELHELLLSLVIARAGIFAREQSGFDELEVAGRARRSEIEGVEYWYASEAAAQVQALFPELAVDITSVPAAALIAVDDGDAVRVAAVRGHCAVLGPTTAVTIALRSGLAEVDASIGLLQLESRGEVLRGHFSSSDAEEFCDRALLARIHRRTISRLRRAIAPVSRQDYLRFLMQWQYLGATTRLAGHAGLRSAILRLQGYEAPAHAWEADLLSARVVDYQPSMLDELCLAGEIAWMRLTIPGGDGSASRRSANRATRIALFPRRQLPLLLAAARGDGDPSAGLTDGTLELLNLLRERGALFFEDLIAQTTRLPEDVERRLLELVAAGLVSSDGFAAIRSLVNRPLARRLRRRGFNQSQRGLLTDVFPPGRWSAIGGDQFARPEDGDLAAGLADILLERYGVVFRDVAQRERWRVPWRALLGQLRLMEARGQVRGGRFVAGLAGEQFALPAALDMLRRLRGGGGDEQLAPAADDPANLAEHLARSSAQRYRSRPPR